MRKERIFQDCSQQLLSFTQFTSIKTYKHSGSQTQVHDPLHVAVQTYKKTPLFSNQIAVQTSQEESQVKTAQAAAPLLLKFLQKVAPLMLKQLDQAPNQALERLSFTQFKVQRNRLLYRLFSNQHMQSISKQKLQANVVEWNCLGSGFAVGYSNYSHQGGCNHTSFILGWNITARSFKPDESQWTIQTSCCINALSFHPILPHIMTAGNYKGQITVYNLLESQPNIARSSVDQYFHNQAISQMLWWQYRNNTSQNTIYNLISIATDGKILLWDMRIDKGISLLSYPIKGFSLARKREGQILAVGGLSISMNPNLKSNFIVGSQTGSVLRAQLVNITLDRKAKQLLEQDTGKGMKWRNDTIFFMLNIQSKLLLDIKNHVEQYAASLKQKQITMDIILNSKPEIRKVYSNPINSTYEPHFGAVMCIQFSPLLEGVFATCSLDGQLRLYSTNVKQPFIVFQEVHQSILALAFSPTKANVIACCTSQGRILFYDMLSENIINQISDFKESILSMKWNKRHPELLGVSCEGGQSRIYQLSQLLWQSVSNEKQQMLQKIDDSVN